MKKFRNYLSEIHYKDLYGEQFEVFRKKYSKLLRTNPANARKLFVNFTSHSVDEYSSFNPNPSHNDPVGLYAYPLDYVLKHPGDIWYGSKARYLRVVENIVDAEHELTLTYMGDYKAIELLKKVFGTEVYTHTKLAKRLYPDRLGKPNSTGYGGRLFLQCVQIDLSNDDQGDKTNEEYKNELRIRSGKEQRDLLLKMGIYVLHDNARKRSDAVINDREPEQTIFLVRNSFKVVESFVMHQKETPVGERNAEKTTSSPEIEKEGVKLAVKIFAKFGHEIKKFVRQRESGLHYDLFFSTGGFKLAIEFSFPSSDIDWSKFGQKKHRQQKLSNRYYPTCTLFTDHGEITTEGKMETTFDEIADAMYTDYQNADIVPNWTPYTPEREYSERKAEKDKRDKEYSAKERAKNLGWMSEVKNEINEIITIIQKKYGKSFQNPFNGLNEEQAIDLYQGIVNIIDSSLFQNEIKNTVKDYINSNYRSDDVVLNHLFGSKKAILAYADIVDFLFSKGMSHHEKNPSFMLRWLEEAK